MWLTSCNSKSCRPVSSEEEVLRMGQGGNEWVLRFMDLDIDVPRFAAEVENHVQRRTAREAAKDAAKQAAQEGQKERR